MPDAALVNPNEDRLVAVLVKGLLDALGRLQRHFVFAASSTKDEAHTDFRHAVRYLHESGNDPDD